jgi:hypothetical protein
MSGAGCILGNISTADNDFDVCTSNCRTSLYTSGANIPFRLVNRRRPRLCHVAVPGPAHFGPRRTSGQVFAFPLAGHTL